MKAELRGQAAGGLWLQHPPVRSNTSHLLPLNPLIPAAGMLLCTDSCEVTEIIPPQKRMPSSLC